jgi:uncharacterized membrane protein
MGLTRVNADTSSVKPEGLHKVLQTPSRVRYVTLDCARGFAVAAMVIFHILYDLKSFGADLHLDFLLTLPDSFWRLVPASIAFLFYFVAGVSAAVRFETNPQSHRDFLKSGFKLAIWALIITLVTAFVTPELTIYFGTLHCLALSMFLIYPVLRYFPLRWLFGLTIISVGLFLNDIDFGTSAFMWLGLAPKAYIAADWFPLFPWFGCVVLGAGLASRFLPRENKVSFVQYPILTGLLAALGRHALVIYLLHQVFIIGCIKLICAIQASLH